MGNYILSLDKPWERNLILIVEETRYTEMYNNRTLFDFPQLKILPISSYYDLTNAFTLIGLSMIRPNMLLIQSPFNPSDYIEISEAKEELTVNFVSSLIRLCGYLGAQKIEVANLKVVDKSTNSSFSFNIETNTFKVNKNKSSYDDDRISTSFDHSEALLQSLKNKINMVAKFANNKIQKDIALTYMKMKGLSNISYIKDLYEMRVSDNPLIDYDLSFSTTSILQSSFDLISELHLPANLLKGNYQKILNEKIDIFLELKISFQKEVIIEE